MSGTGSRFGGSVPKQFHPLPGANLPVFHVTLEKFLSEFSLEKVVLVVNPQYLDLPLLHNSLNLLQTKFPESECSVVSGGNSRHESFVLGAQYAIEKFDQNIHILVHDANRPYVSPDFLTGIQKSLLQLSPEKPVFLPVIPVNDSICRATENRLENYVDRSELFRIQTPQLLYGPSLATALRQKSTSKENFVDFTDEGSFMKAMGYNVFTFTGDSENIKITYPEDIQ
ncbi:MAG: 2-C-methyl-D-erythritol 4-phosphate cytidylyltransferase [Leptospirales bacterium]